MKLLYIDLFCGAGGTSTGVNLARVDGQDCARVIACVNHDEKAIASHASNHPDAMHFTEDIRTLELSPLVDHLNKCRMMNPDAFVVLWASLECTNFSKAKGGRPRDADSRTLAEHLFRYIEAIAPDYIQIENVEEFMSWGDVDANGKPISMDKGKAYCRWIRNVKKYGYNFEHRILNAADFGAYTSRKLVTVKRPDAQCQIAVSPDDSPMTKKIKGFMVQYSIADIKMRMLKIGELKLIMGFPENYILVGNQTEQKKFIGNAVEVNMARVLCESLYKSLTPMCATKEAI